MLPSFRPDMTLAEMVNQAPAGVLFFHNHRHYGSYEILERAMSAFKNAQVKHFYLEVSVKECSAPLKAHFSSGGQSNDLEENFCNYVTENERIHLKALVIAAHSIGIQVLPVDTNEVLISGTHLAGDTETASSLIKARVSQDSAIAACARSHIQQLKAGDKYIGLFGGAHVLVGKLLNAALVILQPRSLENGATHLTALPEEIEWSDEQSRAAGKDFHYITFVPPELGDSVDLSQSINDSKSLVYLNHLLAKFFLPACQAYRHSNSQKVSAAFFIKDEELSTVWPQVVKWMDPFAKRVDETFDAERTAIIFDDIDNDGVRSKIIASLVGLTKSNPSQPKNGN